MGGGEQEGGGGGEKRGKAVGVGNFCVSCCVIKAKMLKVL